MGLRQSILQVFRPLYRALRLSFVTKLNLRRFFFRILTWVQYATGSQRIPQPISSLERKTGKRVLILDSVLPDPSRDAGSLRTINMIDSLIKLDCRVTFLAYDELGYSPELMPVLEKLGVECNYFPYVKSVTKFLRTTLPDYDVVILERFPAASLYLEIIRRRSPDIPVILDSHDLHHLRLKRQAELTGSTQLAKEAEQVRALEIAAMSEVDCTIVISDVEQAILAKEAPQINTSVLPLLMEAEPLSTPFDERSGIIFVGGFSHQPNIDAVKFFVTKVWPLIKAELPDVVFHVVGGSVPPEIRDLAQADIKIEGFVEDLEPLFSHCRLSVAPLRFGAGVKGKVGTSLSYGLPSVISSIALEGSGLVAERDVLLADAPAEYAKQVVRLYNNQTLWETLSKNGVEFIEAHYSQKANMKKINEILEKSVRQ